MNEPIRTLVVDDSAFVRKMVREMLSSSAGIEVVGTARDGAEALEKVLELKPDVVTCDLSMPGADGVEFVREQMARSPVPILILTASPHDANQALEALSAGAVDVVTKPSALATEQLRAISAELIEKVRAAARVPAWNLLSPRVSAVAHLLPVAGHPSIDGAATPALLSKVSIVVLGISTGGPQGLRRLLPELAADFPVPLAIVLHMPVGYTAPFATKLDELCNIEVMEASEGQPLRPGVALLAPAGRHLTFLRDSNGQPVAHLALRPLNTLHRPAVDVLFKSAAETFGSRVLGVVMTGMGDDGKLGAGWIKANGGTILTEAESSCIIYGMPRSVVEAGLSDRAVPLADLARVINEHL